VRFGTNPGTCRLDVRNCLKSWDALRDEGFAFRMFGDASQPLTSLSGLVLGTRRFCAVQHPAMRSDYLRMCFVLAEGGLYVDADDVLGGAVQESLSTATEGAALCYD